MYTLMYHGRQVGRVTVSKEGMQRLVRCECSPMPGGPYGLFVKAEGTFTYFGTLTDEGDRQFLLRRCSAGRLEGEGLRFWVEKADQITAHTLWEERPFDHICQLSAAYLDRAGKLCILTDRSADTPGSDPSP